MRGDVLANLVLLAVDNAPSPDSDNAIALALIGLVGTIVVALIGLVGTRLIARSTRNPGTPPSPRNDDHEAALERFLMRHGYDPNKIETGDELINDVKFF